MLNSFVSVYINSKWDIKEYFSCNFNFRNPNGNSSGLWTPYTLKGREFINLDLNITMASSLYKDRVHFWLTTVPNLVQGCQPNSVNSAPTDVLNISFVYSVLIALLCIFCWNIQNKRIFVKWQTLTLIPWLWKLMERMLSPFS